MPIDIGSARLGRVEHVRHERDLIVADRREGDVGACSRGLSWTDAGRVAIAGKVRQHAQGALIKTPADHRYGRNAIGRTPPSGTAKGVTIGLN